MPEGDANPVEQPTSGHAAPALPAPARPPTPSSSPHSPPTGTVTRSLRCNGCGYDLIGLPEAGVCPECARPVSASLRGDDLAFAAPAYLESLQRGALLVQLSVVAAFAGFALVILAIILKAMGSPPGLDVALLICRMLAALGGAVAAAIGWWLLSAPDPSRLAGDLGEAPRRLVRITVWAVFLGYGASIASDAVQHVFAPPSTLGRGRPAQLPASSLAWQITLGALGVAKVLGWLAWVVQYFASMQYLAWLAPRIPNPGAAARARTLMWLGPLLWVGLFCVFYIGPLLAQILYFLLIDTIRRDIASIRRHKAFETLPDHSM